MTYPARRGELIGRRGSGGWTVYDKETDSLHSLNDSARAIWELCDGATSPDEMAEAVSELTGIDRRQALDEVNQALDSFSQLGLVES